MKEPSLQQYLNFICEAEGLKSVLRTAWTKTGKQESTAEHSWRLALFALVVLPQYPQLDAFKTLSMCLVHDLGELYEGDISAASDFDQNIKYQSELWAITHSSSLLPKKDAQSILSIWEEYTQGQTKEAQLVKALDKAETILQHSQGANPDGFDYSFNLTYGLSYFEHDDFLKNMRVLLDEETKKKL